MAGLDSADNAPSKAAGELREYRELRQRDVARAKEQLAVSLKKTENAAAALRYWERQTATLKEIIFRCEN